MPSDSLSNEQFNNVALPNPVAEATFAIKAQVNTRRSRPQCSHCGLLGHTKEKCYKLHGYPPGYVSRSKNQVAHSNAAVDVTGTDSLSTQQCQQLIAMLTSQLQTASSSSVVPSSSSVNFAMQGKILSFVNSLSSVNIKHSWIIDSRASCHVCYSKELFESLYPIAAGSILLPNKTVVSVGFAGNVRLSEYILLKNDLCQVIGKGEYYKGLYLLQLSSAKSDKLVSQSESVVNESVVLASWHDRLGHPSHSVLHSLKDVLPSVDFNKSNVCPICPLAKQKHLPFPVSVTVTQSPFEMVHCDIWGPYKMPTHDGFRYFLTLVDDYSRSTWTYLLKHKADVVSIIPSFIALIKRQFGYDIKVFRSDNAPELKFNQLFSDLGIIHHFSCVETPQQNSVVERKHQHLLSVARALFYQARIPIQFWGECILTATYVINRLPSKILDGKSPYELLHSCLPTYSHLRVFGCLCFVSTLRRTRDKFTERALPAVFLGYAPGVKGYKVYVLQNHTIMISRNVVFHEEIFPFHTIAAVDSLVDPFPATVLPHPMQGSSYTTPDSVDQSSVELIPEHSHENVPNDMFSEEAQTSPHVSAEIQNPEVEDTDLVHDVATDLEHDLVEDNQAHGVQNEVLHEIVIPAVRRSTRVSIKPSYLKQYLCNSASVSEMSSNGSSNCLYPIENHISSSRLSPEYVEYIFNISLPCEPVFYHQAARLPEWRDAMQDELQAMDNLQTWTIVPLPAGKKPIDCKWVYRIKRKADGSIDRYKAQLVAKGFTQIEGVDYVDTFSPVAKLTSFKLLLALAAVHDWHLLQLDVNNAFLNGMLNEEVYMKIPLGYATNISGDNLVCKLNKSIYGLKQASRQWFCAFSQVVLQFGFIQSPHEHSLFIKGSGDTLVALIVYVDDIILAGKDLKLLAEVQTFLQSHFKLKDLGNLKYFLGFEVARNKSGISLSQRQYALQLLEDTGSLAKKPVQTPIASPHKLSKDQGQLLADPQLYRRLIGRLLYLTHTRPDITYDANLLSQFVSSPRTPHLQAIYHLLSYVKSSPGLGLFFSSTTKLQLTAFVDSDYNSCLDTRLSTTGYCTFLGETLISWKSKKQHTVSRSSCEAEYRAMAIATCELVWIAALLDSFQIPVSQAYLYCDNQSALHLATNQVFHERTKHIEVDCHFVREKVSSGFLRLFHVRSADQIADFFTKALHYPAFQSFLVKLGLLNIHQSPV
ncbi:hypothetical protein GQ457_01G025390 [Hibiscus cannabinus]